MTSPFYVQDDLCSTGWCLMVPRMLAVLRVSKCRGRRQSTQGIQAPKARKGTTGAEAEVLMRVAIMGSGGLGGLYGGRLAQAGCDVTFIARGAHRAAIQEHVNAPPPRGGTRCARS